MNTVQNIRHAGFTLIELSIVLVIIGLMVGGVLVGRDLIGTAEIRSTLAQIESYRTAANTFKVKFGNLPGDIPAAQVTQLGFAAASSRGGARGRGDGNGLVEGYSYTAASVVNYFQTGETAFYWEDLTTNSQLIPGGLSLATDAAPGAAITNVSTYLPTARFGRNNYIFTYSFSNFNYYQLMGVNSITPNGNPTLNVALSVSAAHSMDQKSDDGSPLSGTVQTALFASPVQYPVYGPLPTAATCIDNQSGTYQYSLSVNNGAGVNCGLSFRY